MSIVRAGGGTMRAAWIVAAIFVSGTVSFAQDKPLGDVAREARAQKAESPQAKKVVTEDDFKPPPPSPVSATDDPMAVVNKASKELLDDTAHICRRQTVNNSGPGYADDRVTEAAAPNRFHIVTSQLRDRMQVRSSERMRIARELHDTLLQAIHGLMLRVHFATESRALRTDYHRRRRVRQKRK